MKNNEINRRTRFVDDSLVREDPDYLHAVAEVEEIVNPFRTLPGPEDPHISLGEGTSGLRHNLNSALPVSDEVVLRNPTTVPTAAGPKTSGPSVSFRDLPKLLENIEVIVMGLIGGIFFIGQFKGPGPSRPQSSGY